MSSTLIDARDRLIAALGAAGVRTATTGKLAAPCVLVEPGDPWTEPQRMPGRNSRWRLTAIGGRTDSEGAYAELGELIDGVDVALRSIASAQYPTWTRPLDYGVGGVPYAASVATIQLPT